MLDHFPLPTQGKPERRHLYRWMSLEEVYVHAKFDADGSGAQREDHDKGMRAHDLDAWWIRQILQYLDRAKLELEVAKSFRENEGDYGAKVAELHEKKAQQAMAKCLLTAKGMCESAIRVFGPMPKPGVPSGEVLHWVDPAYHAALRGDDG